MIVQSLQQEAFGMGTLMTVAASGGTRPATANQLWKARWGIWMVRSTLAAAATHLAVLVVWPAWQVDAEEPVPPPIELIQLTPVAAYGGVTELSEGTVAALPSLDEVELALKEAQAGVADEVEEESEAFGIRRPIEGYPLVPEIVASNTVAALQATKMVLERLPAVTPDLVSMAETTAWPEIRNPTVMRRFLRSRYNPLHEDPGATGMVSVAIWIDERGSVEAARVSESSGFSSLDEIAVALFADVANFAPARSGRRAIPVQVTVSVPFMIPW